MTEVPAEPRFKEVDCKKKCGEKVGAFWHDETQKWCYVDTGLCAKCSQPVIDEYYRRRSAESAGITQEEMKLTLESFQSNTHSQKAYDAARRMATGDSINLLLSGPAGRGKTHLAIGVLNAHLNDRIRFLPITKFLMEVKSTIQKDGEDHWINKALEYRFLVLDDFGANKLTEWSTSFLDCLIDEWYRRRKKGLIITSNFKLKQIAENISDRIASRIAQMCEVHELGGKDWRITTLKSPGTKGE